MKQDNQNSDYVIFVNALLKKDITKLDISPFSQEQKQEIEKVGNMFFERNLIKESIQTFYLLKNINKLIELGNVLLKNKQNEFAFEAFNYAKSKEGLSRVGDAFLSNAEIEKAYTAFKLANNEPMLQFIELNFKKKS